jgi:precorrin-3B synthase
LHRGDPRDAGVLAGPVPYPGTASQAFALAPPFGQFDTGMLRSLAGLAEQHGTTIRITPWRALLLGRVPAGADLAAAAGPAWIADPADPRLNVTACIGAPGCASGSTPTRADAARLAAAMRPTARLHLSGCAKGCAHPGPAPLTLVGRQGRYDMVRDGRAADEPCALALTLDDAMVAA